MWITRAFDELLDLRIVLLAPSRKYVDLDATGAEIAR